MAVTETVILTSGTSWTVPNTWNSSNNTVTCIGGGAGGGANTGSGRGGGGGGAQVINTNVTLTAGGTISYAIGAGGGSGAAGGDTTFNSSAMVAKGGSSTANSSGGSGGTTAASTGTTKYAGGNGGAGSAVQGGGGGGGGAGGTTAGGSNGGNVTSVNGGNGGAGGATGGGATATGTATTVVQAGWPGFNRGDGNTSYGTNYAGGGGAGGGYEGGKGGAGSVAGANGGAFGGGGGGGTTGGSGAPGAIIINWTWQSTLPGSGQLSVSEINTALGDLTSNTTGLGDADARGLAGVASGQISMSDFYGDNLEPTYVSNSSGTGSTTTLPTGWANGDLCVLAVTHVGGETTLTSNGWSYNGKALYDTSTGRLNVFNRILQSGDSAPAFSNSSSGWQMLLFRKASKLTLKNVANNATSNTINLGNITKSSDSKLLLSFVADRGLTSYSNPTEPTGWTARCTTNSTTYYTIESATIRSSSYTNGANVTWNAFQTTYSQCGMLMEIE